MQQSQITFGFQTAMQRARAFEDHHIEKETLSTRERMSLILEKISSEHFTGFDALFLASEGKAGVVVTFLAILELGKENLIELVQSQPYANIHIRVSLEKPLEVSQGVQS